MSAWLIYIWTRLNSIVFLSTLVSVFGCIACVLLFVGYACERTNYNPDKMALYLFRKTLKFLIPTVIVCSFLAIFTPTQKDAAMIYVIPKMAQSETFNAISKETPEITKLALEALKETLQGMTKENKQ